jgi:hypothetical protein
MDESKFCSECGRSLDPGMQFCPQCGKVVSGSQTEEEMKKEAKEFGKALLDVRRSWLLFFLGIYAIPAIIAAAIALADAPAAASAIWSSTEFQDWLVNHGYHFTQMDIQNYFTTGAGLALASGICALISFICVYLRKYWIIAVAACAIASVLCFWSIFGLFIGIMVTFMIVGAKDGFVDTAAPAE